MLVLSRKVGEKIVIDDQITIIVNRVGHGRVVLGIEAPNDVRILRGELEPRDMPAYGHNPRRVPAITFNTELDGAAWPVRKAR